MDNILCVSAYTAQRIREQAPELAAGRFNIFPNALGQTWVGPAVADDEHPQSAELPERFLLSVTRLDKNERYKGLVTALEAFAMLDHPTLHYIVAGGGDDQQFLERVALRLRVRERVRFLGRVSDGDLAQLYRTCAAFVLPSGKEGFGIVFLEAMYFGAPVIAAAAKGAVDVVQHEITGLLVPYGNSMALQHAMERVLVDSELCNTIRVNGRKTVTGEGRFAFDAYVHRVAETLGVPAPAPGLSAERAPHTLSRECAARGV
jgi:phosphatidylinositol alpha-1,6-mannosyltransferase